MSSISEAIVGVTGVLEPEPIDDGTLGAAAELTTPWQRRIKKWVRGKEIKPFARPRIRDWKATRLQLETILTDTQRKSLVKPLNKLDPALANDYLADLDRCREFLLTAFPKSEIDSVMGPHELEPNRQALSVWLSQVAVIEDPDRILTDMEMGTLEDSQVTAFEQCYPEIYLELYGMVNSELTKIRAEALKKKTEARITFDREATIRILGHQGFESMELPEEPAPAKSKGKYAAIDPSRQQIPSDKLLRPL